jgi:anti-sigma B factor antagonist
MQTTIDHAQTALILRIAGNLESESVVRFRAVMAGLPPGHNMVFDLQDVLFVDSAGLGALIGAIRRIRENGGDATLWRPRPSVRRALHLTAIDRSVRVVAHINQAEAHFLAWPRAA